MIVEQVCPDCGGEGIRWVVRDTTHKRENYGDCLRCTGTGSVPVEVPDLPTANDGPNVDGSPITSPIQSPDDHE